MSRFARLAAAVAALLLLVPPAGALDLATFEKNVTVRTLDNGLTILIYERPTAPVVSFFTHVDVGSAQEVPGITGLAHMFEHMAFKGTSKIGTTDFEAESRALAEVERAYQALQAERQKRAGVDPQRIAELERRFEQAQEEAVKLVRKNEFDEIISRAGGVGLNAFTNADTTGYTFALPANKLELWAYLESERFRDPVMREFYKERDVVQEERRMRTESNPIGRLIEQFLATAFTAHPYKQPTVGYMSDLQAFSRTDAEEFYRRYYTPSNITVAVAGEIDADKALPMIERYFSRLAAGPEPPALRTVEPPQITEKTIVMPDASQPLYIEGYHRPSALHADDAVYDAMSDILSAGRTSRLYRSLVQERKIAAQAGAFSGFPGTKYPHLMLFFAIPSPGNDNETVQAAIREEIDRITSELVTEEELKRAKTRAKAGLIRGLASNGGIAAQLATYQAQYGDWRELFRSVDRIERVTREDVRRVAQATFVPTNRTVAMIVNRDQAAGTETEASR